MIYKQSTFKTYNNLSLHILVDQFCNPDTRNAGVGGSRAKVWKFKAVSKLKEKKF